MTIIFINYQTVIPHHTHDIGLQVFVALPACDEWNLPLFSFCCQVRTCLALFFLVNLRKLGKLALTQKLCRLISLISLNSLNPLCHSEQNLFCVRITIKSSRCKSVSASGLILLFQKENLLDRLAENLSHFEC